MVEGATADSPCPGWPQPLIRAVAVVSTDRMVEDATADSPLGQAPAAPVRCHLMPPAFPPFFFLSLRKY